MAELIEELSRLNGVSGNEDAVRKYIAEKISSKANEITVDSIGNLIALKKGRKSGRKIMLASNMDEAGFIVSDITDKGYLKIKSVGNIDTRVIISKKVVVGSGIKGIIGMKAIHLQKKSERESTVPVSSLFVDIGSLSKANALKKVGKGDYVTFDTEFARMDSVIRGKALDRLGCKCLIDAMDSDCLYDTYFVFTAQKETGARGARAASHRIQPDIALTVGTLESADMYGTDEKNIAARLGRGAVIDIADKAAIENNTLAQKLRELAAQSGIEVQERHSIEGRAISGAVQTAAGGTVTGSIAIPCRYSHTPVCMMNIKDIEAASALARLFLEKIGDITDEIIN